MALSMVVATIGLGAVLARGTLGQIAALLRQFRKIAQGEADLTQRLDDRHDDEFDELAREFHAFCSRLAGIVVDIRAGSEQIRGGAHHLSSTSNDLAENASKQAASLKEMATSTAELSSMTRQCADSAERASQFSVRSREHASVGRERTERMMTAMTMVSGASAEVADIIGIIDQIAF